MYAYKRNIAARSRNHFCRKKVRVFVALVIQQAERMRCIVLSSVVGPPYFTVLFHNIS
jgi:hypothetical protein